MGLLSLGTPYSWSDVQPVIQHVKHHGIKQFLNIYHTVKVRRLDNALWGEELEFIVVKFDQERKRVTLLLDAEQTLKKLQDLETEALKNGGTFESSWKPEYARYMLEGTPGLPYGPTLDDLLLVEDNMLKRRVLATSFLKKDEAILCMTNFPRLGSPGCFTPSYPATPDLGSSRSLFIPQEAITKHARFPTLTSNIRERRGEKVAINLQIFKDTYTPSPFREALPESVVNMLKSQGKPIPPDLPSYEPAALEDHVYMDAMCFGMGCSCLQVTIQACSIEHGRRLYDHLTVMTPIMLAISAASPIYRGYLTDVDARWKVIAGSVDDRTRQERGLEPTDAAHPFVLPKSRYESVSRYLSPGPNVSGLCGGDVDFSKDARGTTFFKNEYNDLVTPYDETILKQLLDGGVDELLALHYAHLFVRDPLVIFQELLNVDDLKSADHFENIQSTNWQTMRFKPPAPNSEIGWRVEFRSMDIQLTDHENAAYATFIVLMAHTIKHFDLNFYIPLSKVDENMRNCQNRDAVMSEKFWFRKDVSSDSQNSNGDIHEEYAQFTIAEIMTGTKNLTGVCTLVDQYLDEQKISESTRQILKAHVSLIRDRATGAKITGATWIRNFVRNHPAYKHDSVVNEEITFDLLNKIKVLDSSEIQ